MTIAFKAIVAEADKESPELSQTVTAWHETEGDNYQETGDIVFAGMPSNFKISDDDRHALGCYLLGINPKSAIVTDAEGLLVLGSQEITPPAPQGSNGGEPVDIENLPDKVASPTPKAKTSTKAKAADAAPVAEATPNA